MAGRCQGSTLRCWVGRRCARARVLSSNRVSTVPCGVSCPRAAGGGGCQVAAVAGDLAEWRAMVAEHFFMPLADVTVEEGVLLWQDILEKDRARGLASL